MEIILYLPNEFDYQLPEILNNSLHSHNFSVPVEVSPGQIQDIVHYTAGAKDFPAIFFYLLIAIVMHQIIQEYLLDRVNRKLHLSKIKHAKFNESGQLLSFYIVSLMWAGQILSNNFSIKQIWEDYPHTNMTFMFKFFYIVQISYWLHVYPELYFQKVKIYYSIITLQKSEVLSLMKWSRNMETCVDFFSLINVGCPDD